MRLGLRLVMGGGTLYLAILITSHQRDQYTVLISSLVLVNGGDFETRALAGKMLGDQAELGTVHRHDGDLVFRQSTLQESFSSLKIREKVSIGAPIVDAVT